MVIDEWFTEYLNRQQEAMDDDYDSNKATKFG
jgi:hypothetical protein